jgi:hypothetical protein
MWQLAYRDSSVKSHAHIQILLPSKLVRYECSKADQFIGGDNYAPVNLSLPTCFIMCSLISGCGKVVKSGVTVGWLGEISWELQKIMLMK